MRPEEERLFVFSSSIHYHIKGLRHRYLGPARIHVDGILMWYRFGKIVKAIHVNGALVWYRFDKIVKSIQENGLVEIFPVKK